MSFNLEKDALDKNSDVFGPYVSKTVSITKKQVKSLLEYVKVMSAEGSWTVSKNCAYFAANAWLLAGQLSLTYGSAAGYADPAILRTNIACSYRQYDSHGSGSINAQTDSSSSSTSGSGSSTTSSADKIYWTSSY